MSSKPPFSAICKLILIFVSAPLILFAQIEFKDHYVNNPNKGMRFTDEASFADINGDGYDDLIQDGKWYENMDGEGWYSDAYTLKPFSYDMQAADFDGDGDLDLFVSHYKGLSLYYNLDGLGNFGPAKKLVTFGHFYRPKFTIGDLDGDQDLDFIFYSDANEDALVAFENTDGEGTFESRTIATENYIEYVEIVDFDNDGKQDVIFATQFNLIDQAILLKNLDNSFTYSQSTLFEFDPLSGFGFQVLDFTLNGVIDILYTDRDGLFITTYENNVLKTSNQISDHGWYDFLLILDVDGDGVQDLFTKSEFFLNSGNGLDFSRIPHDIGSEEIYLTDHDNDGQKELIIPERQEYYFYNKGGKNFFEKGNILTNIQVDYDGIAVADFDLDGDSDIIAYTRLSPSRIVYFENDSDNGGFKSEILIEYWKEGLEGLNIYNLFKPLDWDADGDLDIVFFSRNQELRWIENIDGILIASKSLFQFNEDQVSNGNFDIIDFDFDGDFDIVTMEYGSSDIVFQEYVSQDKGYVEHRQNLEKNNRNFNLVDLDVDGDYDLIVGGLLWYENLGGFANYGEGTYLLDYLSDPSLFGYIYFDVGDLDGDGDLDIFASGQIQDFGYTVFEDRDAWFENLDGQGTYSEPIFLSYTSNDYQLRFAKIIDIDGDGDLDMAGYGKWYENLDGEGNFAEAIYLDFNYAEDINQDLAVDFLYTYKRASTSYHIIWKENLGANTNTIYGQVKLDNGGNSCVEDASRLENIMLTSTGVDQSNESATLTYKNGFYRLYIPEGDFTTQANLPPYFSVNPASVSSSFNGVANRERIDFCVSPIEDITDVGISIFPKSEARPGFESLYDIVIKNNGSLPATGSFEIEFDGSKLDYVWPTSNVLAETENSVKFDFGTIGPLQCKNITIRFQIAPPPTSNLDDILKFHCTIEPDLVDAQRSDNTFDFCQTLIGSYDPNDIQVMEGDKILLEETSNYLHYLVRFQNTGTASAINVRVENLLDPMLDWHTFELLNTSHQERVVDINEEGLTTFSFNNIYLPDSISNEPNSHGSIAYRIKPKENIALGDIIHNNANIYFDFNSPVETNTVTTEVVELTNTVEVTTEELILYPNPSSDIINIDTENVIEKIELFDLKGNKLNIANAGRSINVSHLAQGIYFIHIETTANKTKVYKIIKE